MDIGGITMAIADFPRDIFKAMSKKKEGELDQHSTPGDGSQLASLSASDQASQATSSVVVLSDPASQPGGDGAPSSSGRGSGSDLPHVSVIGPAGEAATAGPVGPHAETPSSVTVSPVSPISGASAPRNAESSPCRDCASSPVAITLESALDAGKGVSRIVTTGVKSPMNFCLGLARGFRNAPRLYNDDTVRPQEKVTDLASGFKVAGKEFGFGFYDGLTGLVTQPLKGAEKEGGIGLLKGIGKGIGGLVLKPAAGKFPASPCLTGQH